MTTYYFILLFSLIGFESNAQLHYKEVHINTTFKGNEQYKSMASSLLSACKTQQLALYLPHNKTKKTSYQELLFQLRGWTSHSFNPEDLVCNRLDDVSIISGLFEHNYILWYDNSNVLNQRLTPTYIQLFISADQANYPVDVLGPVFSFDEIMKAKITLSGSNHYLHELIINHNFQGYEVDENGKHISFHQKTIKH